MELHKSPMFSMTFKLVDYCYNMTLIDRNNSILLEPKDTFECYFKIHLPYGNRIELDLYANYYRKTIDGSDGATATATAPITAINERGEVVDLNASQIVSASTTECRHGVLVHIQDSGAGKPQWMHCVHRNVPPRRFQFHSTGNTMILRVTRQQGYGTDAISAADIPLSVYFEYRAVPIIDIVSQCAFGWVAVHHFCLTAVETALPWTMAEEQCKKLGGHLASIKSEREQRIIDDLLLNSVAFKDSAAYWVGASDEIFEGDFRWSNGFPYTYSSGYFFIYN